MSLRHVGPIGLDNLASFCIARVFRFRDDPVANLQAITCKVCGDRVAKGEATEVYILDTRAFLCGSCEDHVRVHFLPCPGGSHA